MQKIRRSAWFVSLVFMTACSDSDPSDSDVNNPTAQNQSSVVPEDAITSPETDVPNLNGNTLDDTTNTETTNESLPPEPTGLKGVVYTDTEIELFWDRSSDTNIVNYTVSRDGAALSTVDALSYFDSTVVSGTTYEYMLQSVDSSGVHSKPVSLFLTTPVQAPIINAANALTFLHRAPRFEAIKLNHC